jgi:predicted kinase
MSEVAFTTMDLDHRGRADLAHRFLNAYLEHTGDYAALAVLSFYLVYRALVRPRSRLLRAAQEDGTAASASRSDGRAPSSRSPQSTPRGAAGADHHLWASGSGKTTISQALLERIGAVRVRSDVERKRMRGIARLHDPRRGGTAVVFARARRARPTSAFENLARRSSKPGARSSSTRRFSARSSGRHFATSRGVAVPFAILAVEAPEPMLRERIANAARGTAMRRTRISRCSTTRSRLVSR